MSDYREYVIETYKNKGEPSAMGIRARPLAGQGVAENLNVSCSAKMREAYPIGTKFVLRLQLIRREDGEEFLYAHHQSPYRRVSDAEAEAFLKLHFG